MKSVQLMLLVVIVFLAGIGLGYVWSGGTHRIADEETRWLVERKARAQGGDARLTPLLVGGSGRVGDVEFHSPFSVNHVTVQPPVKTLSIAKGYMVDLRETTMKSSIGVVSSEEIMGHLRMMYGENSKVSVLDGGSLVNASDENRDHAMITLVFEVLNRPERPPLVYIKGYYARYDPYYRAMGVYDALGADCSPSTSKEVAQVARKMIDDYVQSYVKFQ